MIQEPPILYKRGARWLAFLGPFFFLTYGAVNYFTSTRADVGIIVAPWEHNLPFVPWLMLPYMSIDAFYAASLFLFRKQSALDRHALRLLLATLISLLGFLLYPLQFSFAVPRIGGFNGMLQAMLLGFDKPYNQAPSLHISLLIVLWVVYANKLQGFAKYALHAWFIAIAASVLLVYQHHFVDVWTGVLVGIFCLYAIPEVPFNWRWQPPTQHMRQIGMRYLLGAIVCLLHGLFSLHISWLVGALLLWSALALALVAAAYFGFENQIFQRYKGNMVWPAKFVLAPYLLGSWLSYRYHTFYFAQAYQVHQQVWLGAYPRPAQQPYWYAVLDMTNEFVRPVQANHYKNLPVMDLVPPSAKLLAKAVKWLDYAQSKQGKVLVHCALGLSRSASVVVCWLVWHAHAKSIEDAVVLVNNQYSAAMPSDLTAKIVLSQAHLDNIQQALIMLAQPNLVDSELNQRVG